MLEYDIQETIAEHQQVNDVKIAPNLEKAELIVKVITTFSEKDL